MFNGGAATPFIAHWPAGIKPRGAITDQQAHIIDLMATLVDAAGWHWPGEFDGKPLAALPGKSLRPIFAGETRAPHDTIYFHLMDHRAIIQGNWKLASDWNRPWELFNLATDRTELYDLSAEETERFNQLAATWTNWWSGKNPGLFKFAGNEPTYRHLDDHTEGSQGRNDEPDQTRPVPRKKGKQRP
jgi:arylsulfatase